MDKEDVVLKNLFYVVCALVITLLTAVVASGAILIADQLDKFEKEGSMVFFTAVMTVVVCPFLVTMAGVLWSIRLMEKSDL
jgi:membrane-associated HD superfamily phosphohydrolase